MPPQIKKNIIAKSVLSLLNIAVPILIGPYIIRVLDIDLYTEFNKSLSLLAWFFPFAVFGVSNYGLREISRIRNDRDQVNIVFSEYFFINILTSSVIFIIYLLFILLFISPSGIYFYIYFIISSQILFSFLGVEYVNEAFENYGFILYKNIILRIFYVIFIFLFVRKSMDIINYALISTITALLSNIISFIYIKKTISLVRVFLTNLKKIVKKLFIILLLFNSSMLYTTLDRLFLSLFTKTHDITYYAITQNILTALLSVFLSIILVTIPRLSYYYSNRLLKEFENLLSKSSSLFYLLFIPSCVGICLLSNQIMLLYGGERHIDSGPILGIFSLYFILIAVDNVASKQILFVTGRERLLTKIFFIGGFINLAGNILLLYLDKLTAVNVIITTMISEIFVVVIEQYYIRKINKNYAINKQFIKYILLAAVLFYLAIRLILPELNITYSTIKEQIIYLGIAITICIVLYSFSLLLVHDKIFLVLLADIKKYLNIRKNHN